MFLGLMVKLLSILSVDVSIAVSLEEGLIMPIVQKAHTRRGYWKFQKKLNF